MTAKASIEHSLTDIHSQALAKKKKRKKKASTHKFEALFSAVSAFFLFIFVYSCTPHCEILQGLCGYIVTRVMC